LSYSATFIRSSEHFDANGLNEIGGGVSGWLCVLFDWVDGEMAALVLAGGESKFAFPEVEEGATVDIMTRRKVASTATSTLFPDQRRRSMFVRRNVYRSTGQCGMLV
jgi:hypothetical protein